MVFLCTVCVVPARSCHDDDSSGVWMGFEIRESWESTAERFVVNNPPDLVRNNPVQMEPQIVGAELSSDEEISERGSSEVELASDGFTHEDLTERALDSAGSNRQVVLQVPHQVEQTAAAPSARKKVHAF